MTKEITKVNLSLNASQVRAFDALDPAIASRLTANTYNSLGVNTDSPAFRSFLREMNYAMDAATQPASTITTGSVVTPIQFLQHFLTNPVAIVTSAREIDNIIGRDMAGTWSDEEIVQAIIENLGQARPYTDKSNEWDSSYNVNYERRTIVRFEADVEVGILEEERAGSQRLNAGSLKRDSASLALAIIMNEVGFYGYNGGSERTYGFLNDPYLPAYETVADGLGGDSLWSTKTFKEITADIRTAFSALLTKAGGNIKEKDATVLTLPVSHLPYLTVTNELGNLTVREWLRESYPNCRIESAVQLEAANGSENVLYLHAEKIGTSTVFSQNIQEVLRLVGFEKKAKGWKEVYSNATAGVLLKQPVGIVRYTGI